MRHTGAVTTESRRTASAEPRGTRGPIRRWTRARPADVIDLFVYVVVLNLAIEYVPSVISESFSLSLLTAALLKIALELVILLKGLIITRLHAADTRRAKVVAASSLWVVAAGSKLVVLALVDLVFGDAVSLGGFVSVTLLVVALLVSRAAVCVRTLSSLAIRAARRSSMITSAKFGRGSCPGAPISALSIGRQSWSRAICGNPASRSRSGGARPPWLCRHVAVVLVTSVCRHPGVLQLQRRRPRR